MVYQFKIEYEMLVEDYKVSLTTVLRGFKPAGEFLETWVYHEDDVKSILNILEAAESAGLADISIYIGPDTLRTLDMTMLKELGAKIGTVGTEMSGKGINFNVSFTGSAGPINELAGRARKTIPPEPKPLQRNIRSSVGHRLDTDVPTQADNGTVHPVYRDKLLKALQCCSHEGILKPEAGLELVQASHHGTGLMVQVDPSNYMVRKAAYHRPASDVQRGLLEVLCRIMEGRPILECSDHAVIYLEYELRDHSQTTPVPGVMTPENADPVFVLPRLLVRNLMVEYRRRTGFTATANFYDPPASAQWRALSENERIKRIQVAMDCHHAGRGMEVVGLEGLKRAVVRFHGELDGATERRQLIQVEGYIKSTIEPTLQLYLLPKVDQNKIRRIKEPGTL